MIYNVVPEKCLLQSNAIKTSKNTNKIKETKAKEKRKKKTFLSNYGMNLQACRSAQQWYFAAYGQLGIQF